MAVMTPKKIMAVMTGISTTTTLTSLALLNHWQTRSRFTSVSPSRISFPLRCSGPLAMRLSSLNPPSSVTSVHPLPEFSTLPDRYTKERSSIVVIGLNIHTSPVELREKLAIPEAEWHKAVENLCKLNHIEEAAVLCTCNRMEIYVLALSRNRGVMEVTEWMSKISGVPVSEISQHRFMLYDSDAIQHIFEVSAGLDSLVLGENQIQAQVKQVFTVLQKKVEFGKNIGSLFKSAITVGKRVRSETKISSGAVSVSSAAVELALKKLPEASHASARMLVIGAGDMGKLVIKHLVKKGYKKMVVVNRSEERVAAIRKELRGTEIIYKPLSEMLACAAEADVIYTCTKSESPLFLKVDVNTLPPVNTSVGGIRLFVDISVPRNVGSCVSELEKVRVYNVDDLKEVVAANKEERSREATTAQIIIAEEVEMFEALRHSLDAGPTIKSLRAYVKRITLSVLKNYSSKMGDEFLTEKISEEIMNKLLRSPMQHLRCGKSGGPTVNEVQENVRVVNRMFT